MHASTYTQWWHITASVTRRDLIKTCWTNEWMDEWMKKPLSPPLLFLFLLLPFLFARIVRFGFRYSKLIILMDIELNGFFFFKLSSERQNSIQSQYLPMDRVCQLPSAQLCPWALDKSPSQKYSWIIQDSWPHFKCLAEFLLVQLCWTELRSPNLIF